MPLRTPEPRLPLEPEEYPLYRPPSRIGCSAISVIALVTVLTFALLLWRVTPGMSETILSWPRDLLGASDETEPDTTPGTGRLPTQTANVPAEALVSPTPAREYVKLANTGGQGVRLRQQPQTNAASIVTVGEGATFEIIGADTTSGADTWRHVMLPCDGRQGYVLSRFLIRTEPPPPCKPPGG
jgi:hypothetical protein